MKIASRVVSFIFILVAACATSIILITYGILAILGASSDSADLSRAALTLLPYAVLPAVIFVMDALAYSRLGKITDIKRLRSWAIATVILGGIVPGILMLLLKDEDLKPKKMDAEEPQSEER